MKLIGRAAVKPELPSDIKIHSVINVSYIASIEQLKDLITAVDER